MAWTEAFTVLVVSHLVGDFILQTEFQAKHKRGGLGGDPVRRRALLSHLLTYACAMVPATAWMLGEADAGLVLAAVALVIGTHLVQDDGRLLFGYMRKVKGVEPDDHPHLIIMVDQSFHVVQLFAAALLATA